MSIRGRISLLCFAVMWPAVWFTGCAATVQPFTAADPTPKTMSDAILQEAVKERDAAFALLSRAIAGYCAQTTESVAARQRCLFGKQWELEVARRLSPFPNPMGQVGETLIDSDRRIGHILRCEGDGRQTVCRRIRPAVMAQLLSHGEALLATE